MDIGVGFGKWGFLLREYLEIWNGNNSLLSDKERYSWSLLIDGIEVYEKYIKNLQKIIYDNIFIGDVLQIINGINNYDLFIISDVIEHFEKEQGKELIKRTFNKTNKALLITTPIVFMPQNALYNNPNEHHKSIWSVKDFMEYRYVYFGYTKISQIILLSKTQLKIKLPNINPIKSFIKRFIGHKQSNNINKYGLPGIDRGLFLKLYSYKKRILN
jgi:hypothetical protein